MQLSIRHETVYHYTAPLNYTIQQLRLSPRVEPQQRILSWDIRTSGQRHEFIDAFGNQCHMLTITGMHDEVRIVASGLVDVTAPDRGRLTEKGKLSPLVFTLATRLLTTDAALTEFAQRHLQPGARSHDFLAL